MTTRRPGVERGAGAVASLGVDPWLASIVIALATAGVALSASARAFEEALASGLPIGLAQSLLHFAFGLVLMTLVVIPDYRTLTHPLLIWSGLGLTTLLLLYALVSPAVNGTHRWISIGGVSLQPSELAKPLLVVAVATALGRARGEIRGGGGLSRPLLIGAWLSLLVLAGRDLGTPVLLFGVTLVMAFAAGARLRHVAALSAAGLATFALFAVIEPYRMKRLAGFIHALRLEPGEIDQVPYQLRQSLLAIGSGGVI
ncbi:MAG: FtsW/RodA/SpoVE family cell cycle protein, partial [Acidobacteriota bacterium]|nr:FtsW/RodA/SpoVE family cell cycle protein [Acidobacteriota bacterium]